MSTSEEEVFQLNDLYQILENQISQTNEQEKKEIFG